jgi:ribosomal protein S18 acetylase RimI-like enzyme
MRIEEVGEVNDDLIEAIGRLIGQLSSKYTAPSAAELEQIVAAPGTKLLVAREDDGAIVGTLTLALYRIPTAQCAWIEDVVVDERARGRGIGEALNREALRLAREAGAEKIDLTSRPDREAANRLYARLGFHRRETNVYRHEGA